MTDAPSNSSSGDGGMGDREGSTSAVGRLYPSTEASSSTTVEGFEPEINSSSSPSVPTTNAERQSSTSSSSRVEGNNPFRMYFESNRPQLEALSMIQQWALGIPNPNARSSSANGAEQTDGTERERLANRAQSDTHIMIPSTSGNSTALSSHSNPVVGSSFRTRVGSSPSHLRRGSNENENEPGRSQYASGGAGSHRESFVLDMESGMNSWEADNNADGESSSRRQSDENAARRTPPSGPATPNRDSEGTPTHPIGDRSPAEILRDSPETRAFITEINRYTTVRPFLVIMILKGLMDHGSGIICFLGMVVTFTHANSLLKKEVSKQRKRNLLFLAMITVNLIGCATFIYYVFSDEELYYSLIFMQTKVDLSSFWTLLWVVGVTDFVAKFAAVIAKGFIVAIPASLLPFQKRGKYYLFIEQTSQLYRSFLPIHHWLLYLINSYDGATKMFGMVLAGIYAIFKATDSVQRFKDWNTAFQKLLQNVHYGTAPTAKELDSVGAVCPICHDTFTTPTRLSCTHIFCEECVSTWFDRERTCPMCRAKVVDDPTFRDGSTSQYVQFF